jgi:hypothetical protein
MGAVQQCNKPEAGYKGKCRWADKKPRVSNGSGVFGQIIIMQILTRTSRYQKKD